MPKAIAKNLEFLAPRKVRKPRTIRNTQMSDQLKKINMKGSK
jgi:hypothetical protein